MTTTIVNNIYMSIMFKFLHVLTVATEAVIPVVLGNCVKAFPATPAYKSK